MYSDTAYAPFGEPYAQAGATDLSFTGMNQDTVSGSYDFLYREYSIQGRWPSPDPAGLAAVNVADPQSLNRYAYVLNNPLALIDPLGLQEDGGGAECWRGFSVTEMIGRDAWGNPIYRQSFLGVTNVPCRMGGVPLGMEVLPAWLQKKLDKLPEPPPQPPAPQSQAAQPCIPRSQLNFAARGLLTALSFWAKVSGVTYFAGGSISRTFAKGVGATVGGTYLYAADPQGNQAIVTSITLQGAVGTPAFSAGAQIGSATYQSVQGFLGPSTGGELQGQLSRRTPVVLGGSYSTNPSGISTSAFIGFGLGGRFAAGPAVSVAQQVVPVCPD